MAAAREAGWELLPREWAQRRLREIDELKRQLNDARAAAEGERRGGDAPVTTESSGDTGRATSELENNP